MIYSYHYDTPTKEPIYLKCGHLFCQACFEICIDQGRYCPLHQVKKPLKVVSMDICELCPEHKRPYTAFCNNTHMPICDQCELETDSKDNKNIENDPDQKYCDFHKFRKSLTSTDLFECPEHKQPITAFCTKTYSLLCDSCSVEPSTEIKNESFQRKAIKGNLEEVDNGIREEVSLDSKVGNQIDLCVNNRVLNLSQDN